MRLIVPLVKALKEKLCAFMDAGAVVSKDVVVQPIDSSEDELQGQSKLAARATVQRTEVLGVYSGRMYTADGDAPQSMVRRSPVHL